MHYLLTHTIDRAAEARPEQEAFRCDGEALTYAALVQRANALAHALREQGVTRGDRVGLCMNKSLESAIAVFGIMKAGAAFVPLDPTAPPARLAHMIQHAGVRHVVTHPPKRRTMAAVGEETALPFVIGLDAPPASDSEVMSWAEVDQLPGHAPAVRMMERDLAYIMYTSGSTGTPKGIMHTHHSGLRYAQLAAHTYDLRPSDRISGHAALHFDMSTLAYFAAPLVGATAVLISEPYLKMPASLSQLIEQEQLTIWYSVPFALIQLVLRGVLDQRDCSTIRWVIYGGEPFPPKHLRALMQAWPQVRVSNAYGPAEVNQCTYYHLPGPPHDDDGAIPIGHVWGDTEALILDDEDREVAPGEAGEFVVRTATMMQGYWQRDDLNAKAFFRRTLAPGVEATYYRTGDLLRQDDEGLLHFLGRKDRQIKIRGHRVELDEVEAQLTAHTAVVEAAAFVLPDGAGSQRLVAAAIIQDDVTPNVLLAHAAAHLPWYAVPQDLTCVDAFPRTTSGKIDRNALRDTLHPTA